MKLSDQDTETIASEVKNLLSKIVEAYAKKGSFASIENNSKYSYRIIEHLLDPKQTNFSFEQLSPKHGGMRPLPHLKWPLPQELSSTTIEECVIVSEASQAAHSIWKACNGDRARCGRLVTHETRKKFKDTLIPEIIIQIQQTTKAFLTHQTYYVQYKEELLNNKTFDTQTTIYTARHKVEKETAEKKETSLG